MICFYFDPLLMIDKKGEKNLSLYACFYDYACFYIGIKYWYKEYLFYEHSLVSLIFYWYQELVLHFMFGIKSMFLYLVSKPCFMHVYALSCLTFIAIKKILVYACLSPCICIHVYELSLHIYLFIMMHELRGSFFEA